MISRVLLVLGATLMLALSGTLAWAAVADYQVRGLIPKGVSIVGRDLSGMTQDQARAAIEEAVSTPMTRAITITGDGKTWTLEPSGMVTIDVDKMLADAYSTRRQATLVSRLENQLQGVPLTMDVKPAYTVDSSAVASWVASASAAVDRLPVNAKRDLVADYKLKVTPEIYGAKVNRARAALKLADQLTAEAALSTSTRTMELPIYTRKPKVLATSFKAAIVVSTDRCKVFLYNGDKLVKTYPCAPGQPSWPTPTGDFHVDSKTADAPWYNPHSAWSASMPAVIPGGPDNPMGDRKIGINYAGVFLHGIPPGEYGSIGSHASHGCMRMYPSDIHDLYPRVKLGDPVYIRR